MAPGRDQRIPTSPIKKQIADVAAKVSDGIKTLAAKLPSAKNLGRATGNVIASATPEAKPVELPSQFEVPKGEYGVWKDATLRGANEQLTIDTLREAIGRSISTDSFVASDTKYNALIKKHLSEFSKFEAESLDPKSLERLERIFEKQAKKILEKQLSEPGYWKDSK